MTAAEYLITDEEINEQIRKMAIPVHLGYAFSKGAKWAREKYETKLQEKDKEIKEMLAKRHAFVKTLDDLSSFNKELVNALELMVRNASQWHARHGTAQCAAYIEAKNVLEKHAERAENHT